MLPNRRWWIQNEMSFAQWYNFANNAANLQSEQLALAPAHNLSMTATLLNKWAGAHSTGALCFQQHFVYCQWCLMCFSRCSFIKSLCEGRRQWSAYCLMTQGVPSLSLSWSLLLFLQGAWTKAIQTNQPCSVFEKDAINTEACHLA